MRENQPASRGDRRLVEPAVSRSRTLCDTRGGLSTALGTLIVNAVALLSVLTFVWIWGYAYGVMPREWRVAYWLATIVVALACGVFFLTAGSKGERYLRGRALRGFDASDGHERVVARETHWGHAGSNH